MKKNATFVFVLVLMLILSTSLIAQSPGDYRTRASGNWSMAQNWERFNGATWVASGTAPSGSETIYVQGSDTISVDIAVSITDTLIVRDMGEVDGNNSLTIANGGTYQHDRDGGNIPLSTWEEGSTLLLTGVVGTAPDDRDQNYYNIIFDTPGLGSNLHMNLNNNIIGGDIRVVNTAGARWYLTSASFDSTRIVTIMGDVFVENGTFSVNGTGNGQTTFIVHHYGNIVVTGGSFAISRGSQGSGSGTTTWYLYEGNFSMSNAEARNSNPTPGNAKFVFAKNGTQQLTFDNVTYGGGNVVHFEVADSTTLQLPQDFAFNGNVINRGAIDPLGTVTFTNGAVYEHAHDGGSVPSATWETGSTALFTGITGSAPGNRGQDYYNLTLNTPNLGSNRDLDLNGHTIGGDITVINTGSARWQMVGGSSGTVTIMGDVIVQDGQFATQGTGSATDVVVDHYGDINVTGGNFSVSRGSQGSGTGSTRWYLHEGNFSMSNATTQNSNATNAWFVFDRQGTQTLTLGEGNTLTAFPIEVKSGTTLDMGASALAGSGIFTLNEGATLITALAGGIDEVFNTVTGTVTLAEGASYGFNGTTAQVTSSLMPTTVNDLLSNNPAGLTLSQATIINGKLRLMAGVFDNTIPFTLGPNGSISYEGGSLKFAVAVDEQLPKTPTDFALFQNYPNPFSAKEHGTLANPSTIIRYDLPKRTHVTLKIYDIMGHLVAELVNGVLDAGTHQAEWNARGYANGVYYYRISADAFTSVRKLVLMK